MKLIFPITPERARQLLQEQAEKDHGRNVLVVPESHFRLFERLRGLRSDSPSDHIRREPSGRYLEWPIADGRMARAEPTAILVPELRAWCERYLRSVPIVRYYSEGDNPFLPVAWRWPGNYALLVFASARDKRAFEQRGKSATKPMGKLRRKRGEVSAYTLSKLKTRPFRRRAD
jgi:hypothetical protein